MMHRNVLESAILQLLRHRDLLGAIYSPCRSSSLITSADGRHVAVVPQVSNFSQSCNDSGTGKADGIGAPPSISVTNLPDSRRMLATAAAHAICPDTQPYLKPISVLHNEIGLSATRPILDDVMSQMLRHGSEERPWHAAFKSAEGSLDRLQKAELSADGRMTADNILGGSTMQSSNSALISRIRRRPAKIRKAHMLPSTLLHSQEKANWVTNLDLPVSEKVCLSMAQESTTQSVLPQQAIFVAGSNASTKETFKTTIPAVDANSYSVPTYQQSSAHVTQIEGGETSTQDSKFLDHGFVYSSRLEEGYQSYLRSLLRSAKQQWSQRTLLGLEGAWRSGEDLHPTLIRAVRARQGSAALGPRHPIESVPTAVSSGWSGVEGLNGGLDGALLSHSREDCTPCPPSQPTVHIPTFEEYSMAAMAEMTDLNKAALQLDSKRILLAGKGGSEDKASGASQLLGQWQDDLTKMFKTDSMKFIKNLLEMKQQQSAHDGPSQSLGQSDSPHKYSYNTLLSALPPETLAGITTEAVLGLLLDPRHKGRARFTYLARSVGEAVFDRLRLDRLCWEVKEKERQEMRQEKEGLMGLDQAKSVNSGKNGARSQFDLETVFQDKLEKGEETYLKSRRCLKRLRGLIKDLEISHPGMKRQSLMNKVERQLDLKSWRNEDGIIVGAELINALLKSAKIETPSWSDLDDGHLESHNSRSFDFLQKSKQRMTEGHVVDDRRQQQVLGASEPAFQHYFALDEDTPSNRFKVGFVEIKEAALKQLLEGHMSHDMMCAKIMPMAIPPRPWTHYKRGGYLTLTKCMARGHRSQVEMLDKAHRTSQLKQVYHGLNVLGELPWRINTDVLGVMEELFNARQGASTDNPNVGEEAQIEDPSAKEELDRLAGLALQVGLPKDPGATIPFSAFSWVATPHLRLSREGISGGQLLTSSGPPLRSEMARQRQLWEKKRSSRFDVLSIESFFALRLNVARKLRDTPRFYYPHNFDFRGRAYPMHPYLHHMGDDVSRGLLTFAEARPLGPRGLDWMLSHVASLWGQGEDKRSNEERREFTQKHMAQVLHSALNPLEPYGEDPLPWWMSGEKPWQLLAACFDVQRAIASGNPETYLSNLPVHQDGSCNGLQHYAALARDKACAKAVNMLPVDDPQDVYSAVAAAVQKRVQEDASLTGLSEAVKLLERNHGVIDRKLVKQTVMTSVYGVTAVGARSQISNRLTERGWTNEAEIFQVSRYLAACTFKCMGEVFSNANNVKDWLMKCAQTVASTGRSVSWTSPLGFPVTQPYKHYHKCKVETSLQNVGFYKDDDELSDPSMPDGDDKKGKDRDVVKVDKRAQTTAFPPNFIHSLDSTHMIMTAIECSRRGVAFAGVHDSFWTHAGTVEIMSELLRHTFVQLHSMPLLKTLETQLSEQLEAAKHEAELEAARKTRKLTKNKNGKHKIIELDESGTVISSCAHEEPPLMKKLVTKSRQPLELPPMPPTGDLNLEDVKNAQYFFS